MDNESLTRSEVINTFGEMIGQILLDGGYSSLTNVINATDEELLAVEGMDDELLQAIRLTQFPEVEEEIEDGLEEETADEPEVEETDAEEDEPVSEDDAPAPESAPPEATEELVDEVEEDYSGMSVRLRRIKMNQAKAEAERKREQELIEANRIASGEGIVDDLGSVGPDFVPIEDRVPPEAVVTIEAEIEVEEVEAEEVEAEEIGPDG